MGEALLFFGCREKNCDYLYEEDWRKFVSDAALSQVGFSALLTSLSLSDTRTHTLPHTHNKRNNTKQLHTTTQFHAAFSRETAKKMYVQDSLCAHGPYVVDLILRKQAYFFVCGYGRGFWMLSAFWGEGVMGLTETLCMCVCVCVCV